jgi:uncharacterized membrane protein
MNKEQKKFVLWLAVAGFLFLVVSIHDVFFPETSNKSALMIFFEIVAAVCFFLNSLIQWRKHRKNELAKPV